MANYAGRNDKGKGFIGKLLNQIFTFDYNIIANFLLQYILSMMIRIQQIK